MNKLALAIAGILCAVVLSVEAGQGKHKLSSEQQALKKEMLEKYDTNKDGKLSKQERSQISKEDRERLQKAGLGHKKGHASKKPA